MNNLREEWKNYLTLEMFHGDMNQAKRKDVQMFADWWLGHFTHELETLRERINQDELDARRKYHKTGEDYYDGKSAALSEVDSLLSDLIGK